MVGLVLWIDENTFATGLIAKAFKLKNLPFYTIERAIDFSFLVDDLKPEVLVLDSKTAIKDLEALERQFQSSTHLINLPAIIVDPAKELSFIKAVIGFIHRPFDPFTIPETIEKMLSTSRLSS